MQQIVAADLADVLATALHLRGELVHVAADVADRAAVMPDGSLVPCVVGRWLDTGNVKTTLLAQILAGPE